MIQKKEDLFNFIEEKSSGSIPLFLVIRGSHAYGTNIETSDTDYAGVFIQPIDDILGNKYKEQINDDSNDTVIYEVRRFLELLCSNNPTVLELLNTPEECIIYKNPVFDEILNNRDKFLTKVCAKSFGGYAIAQIKKSKGQDKKQNWELDKVTRKSPLDFCYLHIGTNTFSLRRYFDENNLNQRFAGVSKMPHGREVYALYYDYKAQNILSENKGIYDSIKNNISKFFGFSNIQGFKGIAFETSNEIRLSSIPYNCPKKYFMGHISYNKDGYMEHCKDYKSYQTWLEQRNDSRWVDVKSHNQKIDGKNMMHCVRLTDTCKEIARGEGIKVRRENKDYLISIRRGEVDLQTLIDNVENDILEIDELFKKSNLPDSVDPNIINELLIKIRKEIYK